MEIVNTSEVPTISELFEGRVRGYVYECYDGDTFKCIVNIPGSTNPIPVKICCRMLGYDSPELRTKDINEEKLAIQCRDILRDLILGTSINMTITGTDKYGRFLVTVEHPEDPEDIINNMMIDRNLGHPYKGGRKNKNIIYNEDGTFTRDEISYTPVLDSCCQQLSGGA